MMNHHGLASSLSSAPTLNVDLVFALTPNTNQPVDLVVQELFGKQ